MLAEFLYTKVEGWTKPESQAARASYKIHDYPIVIATYSLNQDIINNIYKYTISQLCT